MTALLDSFCRDLAKDRPGYFGVDPSWAAHRFVEVLGLSVCPRLDEIKTLLQRLGITSVMASELPNSCRGLHASVDGGQYQIEYEFSEWDGAQEHTLLHETYEIISERLQDIFPSMRIAEGNRLCRDADRFAAASLMQPEMFSLFAQTSGFDVVALQRTYRRSYASLTLRLAEVLRDQPLVAALYERCEEGDPANWNGDASLYLFRAAVVARTPGFRVRVAPGSGLSRELPYRRDCPSPGSAVDLALSTREPVLVDVSGGEVLGREHLVSVAARPVLWHGKVAKVAFVAVPLSQKLLLYPGVKSSTCHRPSKAFQVT